VLVLVLSHHHHLHGLGHSWSIPSFWRVCWSLHLNCGCPVFHLFLGYMLEFCSGSACLPFIACDSSTVIWICRILSFRLKMLSSFLILVFLIWSFLVFFCYSPCTRSTCKCRYRHSYIKLFLFVFYCLVIQCSYCAAHLIESIHLLNYWFPLWIRLKVGLCVYHYCCHVENWGGLTNVALYSYRQTSWLLDSWGWDWSLGTDWGSVVPTPATGI
jgi:hypothetical protein